MKAKMVLMTKSSHTGGSHTVREPISTRLLYNECSLYRTWRKFRYIGLVK